MAFDLNLTGLLRRSYALCVQLSLLSIISSV
jgi:hypothetical protein